VENSIVTDLEANMLMRFLFRFLDGDKGLGVDPNGG
jgi:hypothetical protein